MCVHVPMRAFLYVCMCMCICMCLHVHVCVYYTPAQVHVLTSAHSPISNTLINIILINFYHDIMWAKCMKL